MQDAATEPLLSTRDVIERTGLPYGRVLGRLRRGSLRGQRIDGRWFTTESALRESFGGTHRVYLEWPVVFTSRPLPDISNMSMVPDWDFFSRTGETIPGLYGVGPIYDLDGLPVAVHNTLQELREAVARRPDCELAEWATLLIDADPQYGELIAGISHNDRVVAAVIAVWRE